MRPKAPRILAFSSLLGFVVAFSAGSLTNVTSHRTAAPPTTVTVPTTTAPGVPTTTRRATGAVEQFGFGQVAVTVTVHGRHIVDVSVASETFAESYSQSLAAQAIPVLRDEVLASQSTQVSGVSGATYTSQGYLASVQSALDALGV